MLRLALFINPTGWTLRDRLLYVNTKFELSSASCFRLYLSVWASRHLNPLRLNSETY